MATNNDFKVTLEGTMLKVTLGRELSTTNSAALTEEFSKFVGQKIERIEFEATQLLFLSSSGIRSIFYAKKNLKSGEGAKARSPQIVFVNCAKTIKETLDLVGFSSSITYLNVMNKAARQQKVLDEFAANNDVVCYSMKIGQTED